MGQCPPQRAPSHTQSHWHSPWPYPTPHTHPELSRGLQDAVMAPGPRGCCGRCRQHWGLAEGSSPNCKGKRREECPLLTPWHSLPSTANPLHCGPQSYDPSLPPSSPSRTRCSSSSFSSSSGSSAGPCRSKTTRSLGCAQGSPASRGPRACTGARVCQAETDEMAGMGPRGCQGRRARWALLVSKERSQLGRGICHSLPVGSALMPGGESCMLAQSAKLRVNPAEVPLPCHHHPSGPACGAPGFL